MVYLLWIDKKLKTLTFTQFEIQYVNANLTMKIVYHCKSWKSKRLATSCECCATSTESGVICNELSISYSSNE